MLVRRCQDLLRWIGLSTEVVIREDTSRVRLERTRSRPAPRAIEMSWGSARGWAWIFVVAVCSASTPAEAFWDELEQDVIQARDLFEGGDYYNAAELLLGVIEEAPDHLAARVALLRVRMAEGAIEAADKLGLALMADRDRGTEHEKSAARHVLAEYAFMRGRVDESLRFGREAVAADPTDLHGHYLVARALDDRGERAAARDVVDAAAALRTPRDLDADGLLDLARLYEVARTPDALELAAQCCVYAEQRRKREGRPTTDVLVLLGDLYLKAKKLSNGRPTAFATYLDALEQNRSLVAAKVGRAWTHLYVNDTYDAEKEIDEALAINPSSVEALIVKAWIRVIDFQASEALVLLDRALEVNPSAKKARSVRAAALFMLGRHDEYEAETRRVLELDPTYGELYWTVGDALSRVLRFADAVKMQELAVDLDPELPLARISLGRDLAYAGRQDEARAALEESKETHPFAHPWRHNMLLLFGKFDREFVTHPLGGFLVRMHVDENPVLGPRLDQALTTDLKYLSEKYQWTPPADVLVEMFPDHQDFSVRSVGMTGLSAVGACFGGLVTLVSPRSAMRHGFVWRRTALHELAHVVTIGRSKGRVPRWLTEGLSVFEEREVNPMWGRDQELELLNAWWNDDIIKLGEFNAAFRSPRIGFAYYQGGRVCEFLTQTYGFDDILRMLDAFADDLETPAVIERVFGVSAEVMDQRFRDWVFEKFVKDARVQPVWGQSKRRELRSRVRVDEPEVKDLAELAFAYYHARQSVDADAYLEKALKRDPDHPIARRLAAFRAMDRGREDLALQHLEAAFDNGGEEYFAAQLLATLRERKDDHDGAREAFELARRCFATDVGPANPDVALSRLYAGEGATELAMEALRRFVQIAESDVKARIDLATWYLHHDRFEEGLSMATEAVDIDPFIRKVHVLRGRALRGLGEPARAIDAFRSALLVDPRFEPGYSPPPDDAPAEEQLEKDRVERADILVEIAEIEREVGDDDAARRDVMEALRLVPDHEQALEVKGQLGG